MKNKMYDEYSVTNQSSNDTYTPYGLWVIIGLVIVALIGVGYYQWKKSQELNPVSIDQIMLSDIITQVQNNYYIVDLTPIRNFQTKEEYLYAALKKIAEKGEIQKSNYMERLRDGDYKIDVWLEN